MQFFEILLKKHNLERHDGRPLWKYHITKIEYEELKTEIYKYFEDNSIFPCKECTLLIASWWKYEYNRNVPSEEAILESIGLKNTQKNKEQFKKDYKRGMYLLRIEPIRINNKHFFRTLLVQGGLPINRLGDQGKYAYYVSRVFELYSRIGKEQIRYYINEYQALLPQTFQNKYIEEFTLQICEALEKNEPAYLPFGLEEGEELWKKIKQEKEKIRLNDEKFHISLKWIWQKTSETLALKIISPKRISEEWWKDNFRNSTPRIFEIFICGRNVATYQKQRDKNLFCVENKDIIKIKPEENISYRGSDDGCKQVEIQKFISFPQSLNEPFLLSKATETDPAELFMPHKWNVLNSEKICEKIKDLTYGSIYNFTGKITVKNSEDSVDFDSHQSLSEDLFLKTPHLENILDSNVPIIKGPARFHAENELKNKTQEPKNTTEGFIRWKFTINDIHYSQNVFQLNPKAKLEIQARNATQGSIIFKDFGNAIIECDMLMLHEKSGNEFRFEFNNAELPYSIPFEISYPGPVRKKVQIKVLAPLEGAYFKNPENERIKLDGFICPVKLEGYSLVCIGKKAKVEITPVQTEKETKFAYCKFIDIEEGEYSLNEYKKWIEQALSLSDQKDYNIVFNIWQENQTVAKIYFKKFNLDEEDDEIKKLSKMAFRLTGNIESEVEDKDLQNLQESDVGKWIVYNKHPSASASFKPYLHTIGNEEPQNLFPLEKAIFLKNEKERIKEIQEILKNDTNILSSDSWRTVAKYALFFKYHRIPLDTADYFKAILRNQQLAARFFFTLMIYDAKFDDIHNMVKDQNFNWRFISIKVWEKELDVIRKENYAEIILKILEEKFEEIRKKFYDHGQNIYSKHTLRKAFGELRHRLVYEEWWPTWKPEILFSYKNKKQYKQESYIDHTETYHRGIFYAPLSAALLAAGKSDAGWNNEPENYFRYLRCYHDTDDIWFEIAYDFFYQKIQTEIE
jgi:hypothetical protein